MKKLKRIVCTNSIMIPLIATAFLFFNTFSIYIGELNISLSQVYTPFVYVILCLLWIRFLPYQKSCSKTSVFYLLSNLIPLEILLMFVFAQYHAVLAAAIATAPIIISIIFRFILHNDEKKHETSQKEHSENLKIGNRFFVLICSLLFIIPSIMSLFVYKLSGPVLQVQDEPTVISADEKSQEVSLSDDVLKQLKQEQWKNCTLNEKISLLQKVCDYESAKLGIPTVVLKATKLDDFVLGQYDPGKTFICIDTAHLQNDELYKVMQTVLHELYHSCQFYIVLKTDWNSDLAKTQYFKESFDEVFKWKDNYKEYKVGYTDYDAYSTQPLEASAQEFARNEWSNLQQMIAEV